MKVEEAYFSLLHGGECTCMSLFYYDTLPLTHTHIYHPYSFTLTPSPSLMLTLAATPSHTHILTLTLSPRALPHIDTVHVCVQAC